MFQEIKEERDKRMKWRRFLILTDKTALLARAHCQDEGVRDEHNNLLHTMNFP
jgi:hypothetical protein